MNALQEPYKAFRWLMLSDVCFDTKRKCAAQYNRTHDMPYPEDLDAVQPESESERKQDWLSGPIPRRHPQALTGVEPGALLSGSHAPRNGPRRGTATGSTGKKERQKRKKGKQIKGGRILH